jgi:N-acetylmuramoyl-L-alanine amidase
MKKRKNIINKNYADFLISIHADSSQIKRISGISIWMVSDERMRREIQNYLDQNKDIICFSENIKKIFQKNKYDIYLKKTILDLQFNNFRKMEIDISRRMLQQFKKITNLHKAHPNYASLGILSNINIPSVLIETGFITNVVDEKKLQTKNYRNKIANCIYLALNNYFQKTVKLK